MLLKECDVEYKEFFSGESKKKYPSRAAYKLLYALRLFRNVHPINIVGRVCLDLGCAHGGFVQVLWDEGASRIYAVDVGYGILDYSLRIDPRVVVQERRNLRHLNKDWFLPEDLGRSRASNEREDQGLFCTCDVSFISARTVLESLKHMRDTSQILIEGMILVKPQFEASQKTQRGVICDESLRDKLISKVKDKARLCGFKVLGAIPVQPKGVKGNQEYMLYMKSYSL